LAAALASLLVTGLFGVGAAPSASADAAVPPPGPVTKADGLSQDTAVFPRSSYLCWGYRGCKDAGMGNAGYANNNKKMYWRMYAGHNCTNYAAYRMVKSGLPNVRPWSGGGNATFWGTSLPKLTDNVPTVGSVAWWRANTGPAGRSGHVAYVEEVVSENEIIISQDSWGGDFSWARITRASGNWPSGFIHFNDVPLANKKAPVIKGTAKVGDRLTATPGKWRPGDAAVSYTWYADGKPLKRGKNGSIKLAKAQLGAEMTVTATAAKLGYPRASATSAPTPAVLPGLLSHPVAPAISGTPKVDGTLWLAEGSWDPVPDDLTMQWYADGAPIPGADGLSLALTPELVGSTITASVTATRRGYEAVTARAAAAAPVAPGTISVLRQPSVTGTAKPGEVLEVDSGRYQPGDDAVTTSVQWLRDGVPVLNATGPTYQVTALDLGARITAEVTVDRYGYDRLVEASGPTAVVRTTPRIKVAKERLKHRVKFTVTVRAPELDVVEGTILVRVGGGFRQEVELRNGRAKVSVRTSDLRGKKTDRAWKVVYRKSETVDREVRTGRVRMP